MANKIFQLIPKIMNEVGSITKERRNQSQGYAFRGVDDVYLAFQKPLADNGVFCVPTVLETTREERQTKNGGALLYTILKVQFRFYADDGSYVDAVTIGEAMDSGDKSANKAMSAALKYAFFQVFSVPTQEDNDTESTDHEVEPKVEQPKEHKINNVSKVTPKVAKGDI